MLKILCILFAAFTSSLVFAGAQQNEPLSYGIKTLMQQSISETAESRSSFSNETEAKQWLNAMSMRIQKAMPDQTMREDFLRTVHYEASRAGLAPELVLGLIQVESGFKKYALSSAGARGFMQVMPFWVASIGAPEHNLFYLRTNLRYGCTILRHYLDMEHGDLTRALGRYNGDVNHTNYAQSVISAWHRY